MLIRLLIIVTAFSFISCNTGHSQDSKNKIFEYRNTKDIFTIVIVKDHTNQKIAKQKVINRAATIAKKNGYDSFNIILEEDIDVILGKNDWPSAYDFSQNLYQEDIIEKEGYNREKIISESKMDYKVRKALKIKIKCFFSTKGSYKTCEIIKC